MSLFWRYNNLEAIGWTAEMGPSINPDPPEDFRLQRTGSELQIYLRGKEGVYGGALAKGVELLPAESSHLQLSLEVQFDEALLEYGQVLEMDTKFTDSRGWTYPGDFQILVSNGQPQIGNPWFDWGEPVELLEDKWMRFVIRYKLDYREHSISINDSRPLRASQEGWAYNQIVNQLQLCSNSRAGFHTVRYREITVGVQE